MDKVEQQRRRTFEIISKYVGDETNIHIEMVENAVPTCIPSARRIILPSNIKDENIYPALATLIHEAGHIRHTKYDLTKLIRDRGGPDKHIVNATEDARIDRKIQELLPNIRGFFKKLYDKLDDEIGDRAKELPIEVQILRALIRRYEGIDVRNMERNVLQAIYSHDLDATFSRVCQCLESLEEDDTTCNRVRTWKWMDIMKNKLFKAKEENEKEQQGKGDPDDKPCNGGDSTTNTGDTKTASEGGDEDTKQGDDSQGDNDADGDKGQPKQGTQSAQGGDGQGHGKSNPTPEATGTDTLDLSDMDMDDQVRNKMLEADENVSCQPEEVATSIPLTEITKQKFTELLNVKETKTVPDGERLDTDNLTAFAVGDIDGIFCEDSHQVKMKSKVMLVMDCSGSMSSPLFDGKRRDRCLTSTAKSIIKILEDCNQAYGIDVTYELRAFGDEYHKLEKHNWEQSYYTIPDYGTDLFNAFKKAFAEMVASWDVDGNKLILLITDGEVSKYEIENVSKEIMNNASDVRVLVVGIGADPADDFITKVTPHNIIADSEADRTLMEAITDMLS